jgi:dTMP kinase
MTGVFIAFEGPDGSGKSTVARLVSERLGTHGVKVVLTREPGGTPLGQGIRQLLLEGNLERGPITELLMMCADRAEHVRSVVLPALARGECVITDRYSGSTRAYQGAGLGIEPDLVEQAIQIATGGLEPELTVLFDIDTETGRTRRLGRPDGQNDIDRRSVEFHERVREGFLAQAHAHQDRWVVIDAAQPLDDVVTQALEAVQLARSARARA